MEDTYLDTVNQRRGLIPEDLMQFRWLDEIALAPDASQVAYTIRRPDADSNGYITHLYVRELSDLSARRLTSGNCQVSSLAWSRDSSQLAYSYRDETTESVRVRKIADDTDTTYSTDGSPFSSMDWSADGTKLVGVRWTKISRFDDRGSVALTPEAYDALLDDVTQKKDGVRRKKQGQGRA